MEQARDTDARRRRVEDRGAVAALAIDVDRLRPHTEFAPVVEHLTAVQELRRDTSSLLFVRVADLDEFAQRDGLLVPEFIERLEQLGVVVSPN